jgi:hypothetical protein
LSSPFLWQGREESIPWQWLKSLPSFRRVDFSFSLGSFDDY